MATSNNITGDKLISKPANDNYRNSPFWETRKNATDNKIGGGSSNRDEVPQLSPNFFTKDQAC